MIYNDTLMWKEIGETPDVFLKEKKANSAVISKLVSKIKAGNATNFIAAGRGTSNHALIYFKYVLESISPYTVGLAEEYTVATNVAYFDFEHGEEITMFAFALFAQMIACKISCGIGNNPDSPRALNKVTITK